MIDWDRRSGDEKAGLVVVGLVIMTILIALFVYYNPPAHYDPLDTKKCYIVFDTTYKWITVPAESACADHIIQHQDGAGG